MKSWNSFKVESFQNKKKFEICIESLFNHSFDRKVYPFKAHSSNASVRYEIEFGLLNNYQLMKNDQIKHQFIKATLFEIFKNNNQKALHINQNQEYIIVQLIY